MNMDAAVSLSTSNVIDTSIKCFSSDYNGE